MTDDEVQDSLVRASFTVIALVSQVATAHDAIVMRDDRGYWSKIEAYLSARTEAQFTHGICPDCTEKMLTEESFGRSSISQGGRR